MARAHLNKGNVLMKMERFSEPYRHITQLLNLILHYAAAYYNKGNALAKLENKHEAIGAYNIATDITCFFSGIGSQRKYPG
jgi:tetratricopeptide (TPR) repeat protein